MSSPFPVSIYNTPLQALCRFRGGGDWLRLSVIRDIPRVHRVVVVDGAEHTLRSTDQVQEGVHFVAQNLADTSARPFVVGFIVDGGFTGSIVRVQAHPVRVDSAPYDRGSKDPSPIRKDLRLWHLSLYPADPRGPPKESRGADPPGSGAVENASKVIHYSIPEFLHHSLVGTTCGCVYFDLKVCYPILIHQGHFQVQPRPVQTTVEGKTMELWPTGICDTVIHVDPTLFEKFRLRTDSLGAITKDRAVAEVAAHVRLLAHYSNLILRMKQNRLEELPAQLSIALFQIVVSPLSGLSAFQNVFPCESASKMLFRSTRQRRGAYCPLPRLESPAPIAGQ